MKKQNNPNGQKKSVQIKNEEVQQSDSLEENFQTIEILFDQIKKKNKLNEDINIIKENVYGLFFKISNKYFKVIDFDKTILGYQQCLSNNTQSFLKDFIESGCNITNYQESYYEVGSKNCLNFEREFQLIEILEFQGDIEKAINETETFEWIRFYDKARQFWFNQSETEQNKSIVSFQRAFYEIEKVKQQYIDYKFIYIHFNDGHFNATEIQSKVIGYIIGMFKNVSALKLKGQTNKQIQINILKNCLLIQDFLVQIQLNILICISQLIIFFYLRYQYQIISNVLGFIYPTYNLKQISLQIQQYSCFQVQKYEDNLDQLVQFIDKQNQLTDLSLMVYTEKPDFIINFANCLNTKTCLKTLKFELFKDQYQYRQGYKTIDFSEDSTQIVQQIQNLNNLYVLNLKINLNSKYMEVIAEQLMHLKELVFIQLKFTEITIQEDDEQESLVIKLFTSIQTLKNLNYLKLSFDQNNKQDCFFKDLGNGLSKIKQVKHLNLYFLSKKFSDEVTTSCFFNKLSANTSIQKLKIKILGELQQESLFHLVKNLKSLSHLYLFKARIYKYLGPISKVNNAIRQIKKLKRLSSFQFNVLETTVNWLQV
ncbi:hypothetical protein ABPG74_019023 [Tetrahymena malaccensis]